MKSRFAPVKRPLLALTALAATLVATGFMPAQASGPVQVNNLSRPQRQSVIRVKPVLQDRTGLTKPQVGDEKDPTTNPNRTVGDVNPPPPVGNGAPCVPFTGECYRSLAANDPAINPSAADGHTHYHTGDKFLIVNETAGFALGDTIMIGSPNCNHAFLGPTCKAFKIGFGVIDEQPNGEIAHIVAGDAHPAHHGVGVLELAEGLTRTFCYAPAKTPAADLCAHIEGEQVVKLQTTFQGQQARVDIPHFDLLNCGDPFLVPPGAPTCNANDVAVSATFIPPQGSHNPSFPGRPLALNRDNPNGPFTALVPALCGPPNPPCGSGLFSFYIPKDIMEHATIGKGFDVNTTDTWYSIKVEARDVVSGAVVADGIHKYKLNPVAILNLRAENPTRPGDDEFFPTESVEIIGEVRDNSSSAALYRPAEDLVVDVVVTKPDGSDASFQTNSCVDTDPTPSDVCGGNIFRSQPNNHGNFLITFGGPSGLFLFGGTGSIFDDIINAVVDPGGTLMKLTCNGGAFFCAIDVAFGMLDTFDTGTYEVDASLRNTKPQVTASNTFTVVIIS